MPGPAVHNVVGWKLADEFDRRASGDQPIPTADPDRLRAASKLVEDYPAHVALGSQGPDFLFFNLADWKGKPSNVPELMIEVTDAMRTVRRKIREAFPFIEKMHDAADKLEEESPIVQEFKNMLTTVRGFSAAIAETVKTAVESMLLDAVDVYSLLAHPIQESKPPRTWWWFDTLHYYRAGEFAEELLASVDDVDDEENASRLHAYTIGYLSHVAGDTIGHPYVNTVARGPYRTYGQRHKTVENYQDAWAYAKYHGEQPDDFGVHNDIVSELREDHRVRGLLEDADLAELTSSRLHERNLLLTESSTEHHLARELPPYIAEAMSSAAQTVYGDDDLGEFPMNRITPDDLDVAYRTWYRWFESATETGTLERELPEYDPPGSPVEDRWEEFVDSLGDVAESVWNAIKSIFENGLGGSPNFDGILNALRRLGEALAAGLAAVLTTLDWLASQLLRIPTEMLRLILEGVYDTLYQSYETFHEMVALLGFGYPLPHQILRPETRNFVYPFVPDALDQRLDGRCGSGPRPSEEASDDRWVYPMRAMGKTDPPGFRFEEDGLERLDRTSHLIYASGAPGNRDDVEGPPASGSIDDHGRTPPQVGPADFAVEWPAYYIDGRSLQERLGHVAEQEPLCNLLLGDVVDPDPRPGDRAGIDIDHAFVDALGTVPEESELLTPTPPSTPTAADEPPIHHRALRNHVETPTTAVQLTVELYRRHAAGQSVPDVNLDGDRGLGYGSWIAEESIDEGTFNGNQLDETVTPRSVGDDG